MSQWQVQQPLLEVHGTNRDVRERMTVLALGELETVRGGAASSSSLGRCGPGNKMKFLGNIYTPECKAHDIAVRSAMSKGSSFWGASLKALPLLGPAIGSYFRERFKK